LSHKGPLLRRLPWRFLINMKRIPFYITIGTFLLLISHSEMFACSCVPPQYGESIGSQVRKAKVSSEVVFTGEVMKVVENFDDSYMSVELKVLKSWKGQASKEITILTGVHDGNCRFNFQVGIKYLIYASKSSMYTEGKKHLITTMCDRTAELSNAQKDIILLNKSRKSLRSKSNR
jgi:hypothetical protein